MFLLKREIEEIPEPKADKTKEGWSILISIPRSSSVSPLQSLLTSDHSLLPCFQSQSPAYVNAAQQHIERVAIYDNKPGPMKCQIVLIFSNYW